MTALFDVDSITTGRVTTRRVSIGNVPKDLARSGRETEFPTEREALSHDLPAADLRQWADQVEFPLTRLTAIPAGFIDDGSRLSVMALAVAGVQVRIISTRYASELGVRFSFTQQGFNDGKNGGGKQARTRNTFHRLSACALDNGTPAAVVWLETALTPRDVGRLVQLQWEGPQSIMSLTGSNEMIDDLVRCANGAVPV